MFENTTNPAYIVSTDLDGTLLDHHSYDWHDALPAIEELKVRGIPIVFNTSKTLAEAAALQKAMDISAPLIVENGSAMAVPTTNDCSHFQFDQGSIKVRSEDRFRILIFGTERDRILRFIADQRRVPGMGLEGFNDWSIDTIAMQTGLSTEAARLSSQKKFTEPFIWLGDDKHYQDFCQNAKAADFQILQGGRFFHLQGKTNKATPLQFIRSADRHKGSNLQVKLICLGDNKNDVHMLNAADIAVCVKSPVSDFPELNTGAKVIYTEELGPKGWNAAINSILSTL